MAGYTSFYPIVGSPTNGVVVLFGRFTTSTSGTISASSCDGFTVTKTATEAGRYTITLNQNYNKFLGVNTTQVGPDDTAMTDAQGLWSALVRDIDVGAGANDGTFEVQFINSDSGADAELQDAAIVYLTIWVKNSSV